MVKFFASHWQTEDCNSLDHWMLLFITPGFLNFPAIYVAVCVHVFEDVPGASSNVPINAGPQNHKHDGNVLF